MITSGISLAQIDHATGGRIGTFDMACPLCGPYRKSPVNQRRKVLRIWRLEPGFAGYQCARCGVKGCAFDRSAPAPDPIELQRARTEAALRNADATAKRLDVARFLWHRRRPIAGSAAETYLRARGYNGPIPATLAFLPASGDHPPAVIAAYGIATEPEPGVIAIAENAVLGVHLIKLKPDGSDRLRDDPKCKFTIGKGFVAPIVLAPPNDLLGMVIAEGIEDGLNAHEASGLGAWAAGTATRLPALAGLIPSYIECVTILVDDDDAGRTNSHELMARLRDRDIEVRLTSRGSFS
jgi:hypothetical protein